MEKFSSILLLREGISDQSLEEIESSNCQIKWKSSLFDYVGARIPVSKTKSEVERLKAIGTIGAIVRERVGGEQESDVDDPATLKIDPKFDHQKAVNSMGSQLSNIPPFSFEDNLNIGGEATGSDTSVAVLDSGIHPENPHVGEIRDRYNFTEEKEYDQVGHGTAVASVLRRTAPDTEIYDMKVVSKNQLREAWVIQALEKCVEIGVNLVSMSLGFLPPRREQWMCPLCTAVNRMSSVGMYITAAAGNHATPLEPSPQIMCPARAAGCISVGATNQDFQRQTYSPEADTNVPDEWEDSYQ